MQIDDLLSTKGRKEGEKGRKMKHDMIPKEWFSNVSFHRTSRKAFTSLLLNFHNIVMLILLKWE